MLSSTTKRVVYRQPRNPQTMYVPSNSHPLGGAGYSLKNTYCLFLDKCSFFDAGNDTRACSEDKILAADSVTEHAQIYKTMKAALAVQQEGSAEAALAVLRY